MAKKLLINYDAGGLSKIVNLPNPSASGDVANKAYVDALKAGLDWKESARIASTANVTVSAPGANIDGVALTSGDRILLKDQTAPEENGIYVWNGAATPATRATDADVSAEVTAGLVLAIEDGTANADTVWLLSTSGAIVLGTTGLAFSQLGAILSAGTGITKTGNVISLTAPVTIALGGTNSTTAGGARTNLGATGKFAATITGDDVLTQFTVNHNLGSTDVVVSVKDSSLDEVEVEVRHTDANNVRITFQTAPANTVTHRVVVVG